MLAACKREAMRSEKLALVSPKHYILAQSNWAALLFLHGRYTEAEETLRNVQKIMDKVGAASCMGAACCMDKVGAARCMGAAGCMDKVGAARRGLTL